MRKFLVILVLLLLQLMLHAQEESIVDSLKENLSHRKLNGFLSLITDFTINEHQQFASVGMGGAFIVANKFYIGGYGLGLISPLRRSDILTDNTLSDYHLNYAHGGLWLGIIDSPCKQIHSTFSLKIGWGSLFMHNINNTMDYSTYRDDFFVITPQLETGIVITNWLRVNFGLGVRFLSGISALYRDSNGNMSNIYSSSDFEGLITSFTLNLGSFCNKNPH